MDSDPKWAGFIGEKPKGLKLLGLFTSATPFQG
jgi:hypothetical protein